MFKTLFLVIYCLITAYIYWRAAVLVKRQALFIRILTALIPFLLCLTLIILTQWGESLPFAFNLWGHRVSHLWLFSFAYTVPLALGYHILSFSKKQKRRHWFFLWCVLMFGTTLLLYGYHQYKDIKVVELEIPVENWNGVNGKPLTVVFASDLHIGYTITKPRAREMMEAIMDQRADLILLGGDIIDRSVIPLQKQNIQEELSGLKAPLGVYTVMGNHEGLGMEVRHYIQNCGIKTLVDTCIHLPGIVNIIGRSDLGRVKNLLAAKLDSVGPDDFRKPLKELKAQIPPEKIPTILLDHAPKIPLLQDLNGIQLMLSGHTHNGQIFPFNVILKAKNELSYGPRMKGNTLLYVTSGLGLWGARFRLGTQTEIVRIRFVPQKKRKVQILFTSDMHSQMQPDRKTGSGGFARLSTAIADARKKFNGPTVLVDAGDFSMGTKYHTLFTHGFPELCLMHRMGYDGITIGNHEFDFSAYGLENALKHISDTNALHKLIRPNLNWALAKTPSTRIVAKCVSPGDSVHIGIFSLLGKEAIADAPTAGITFTDPFAHASHCVKILKQRKVDLIVALSHNGLNQQDQTNDLVLARKVPGIDVLISGHSHTVLKKPVISQSIIVAPGSRAAYLGDLIVSENSNRWRVNEYHLIPLDATRKEDPNIRMNLAGLEPQLNQYYFSRFGCEAKTKIGVSNRNYPDLGALQNHFGDNPITNLITDAFVFAGQKWSCHTGSVSQKDSQSGSAHQTIAVLGMGNVRSSLPLGDLYAEDIFNLLSFGTGPDGLAGFPLISVYLTRSEIATLCEIDANIGKNNPNFQLQFSGLSYASNPYRPLFNRVYHIQFTPQAKAKTDQQLIQVITNLYAAQRLTDVKKMSHGLLSVTPRDENGSPVIDINSRILRTDNGTEVKEWWAVLQYIREHQGNIPNTPPTIRKNPYPDSRWALMTSLFGHYNLPGWIQVLSLILLLILACWVIRFISIHSKR